MNVVRANQYLRNASLLVCVLVLGHESVEMMRHYGDHEFENSIPQLAM